MARFSPTARGQLKKLTAQRLIRALKQDGFLEAKSRGATRGFIKSTLDGRRKVVIHFHPRKSYGWKLLSQLLDDIGWTENDLERLGLIKKH